MCKFHDMKSVSQFAILLQRAYLSLSCILSPDLERIVNAWPIWLVRKQSIRGRSWLGLNSQSCSLQSKHEEFTSFTDILLKLPLMSSSWIANESRVLWTIGLVHTSHDLTICPWGGLWLCCSSMLFCTISSVWLWVAPCLSLLAWQGLWARNKAGRCLIHFLKKMTPQLSNLFISILHQVYFHASEWRALIGHSSTLVSGSYQRKIAN